MSYVEISEGVKNLIAIYLSLWLSLFVIPHKAQSCFQISSHRGIGYKTGRLLCKQIRKSLARNASHALSKAEKHQAAWP
jgi:hypothetical protein